jgi:hypothetical protein
VKADQKGVGYWAFAASDWDTRVTVPGTMALLAWESRMFAVRDMAQYLACVKCSPPLLVSEPRAQHLLSRHGRYRYIICEVLEGFVFPSPEPRGHLAPSFGVGEPKHSLVAGVQSKPIDGDCPHCSLFCFLCASIVLSEPLFAWKAEVVACLRCRGLRPCSKDRQTTRCHPNALKRR